MHSIYSRVLAAIAILENLMEVKLPVDPPGPPIDKPEYRKGSRTQNGEKGS